MERLLWIRNHILRRFINVRLLVSKGYGYDELIRLEILVATIILAYILGTGYIVVSLIQGTSWIILSNYLFFHSLTLPLILWVIRKGYGDWAKFSMAVFGTLFMTIKAGSLGRGSGMDISMLMIIAGAFTFFPLRQYYFILATLVLTLICYVFLEWTDYSYFGTQTPQPLEYWFNLYTTIGFLILFYIVTLRNSDFIQKKVTSLNKKLIIKNKKLISVNEELDRYVYRVSHDMRSPLTSMMSLNQLIVKSADEAEKAEMLQLQQECMLKLDQHIQQIIDISKNLKTEPVYSTIAWEPLVEQVLKDIRPMAEKENIHIEVQVQQSSPFVSDINRLQIILSNLLSNSFKYYDALKTKRWVRCSIQSHANLATITIADNGIGISKEAKIKLFTMFFRGTTQSKGSGLGLYIVKEMVHKLGGSIQVDSEIDSGTRFTIQLPQPVLSKE